jgi:hypothetical protein
MEGIKKAFATCKAEGRVSIFFVRGALLIGYLHKYRH